MKLILRLNIILLMLFFTFELFAQTISEPFFPSWIAPSLDGKYIYSVSKESSGISKTSIETGISTIVYLKDEPDSVLAGAQVVYVSTGCPDGKIYLIDSESLNVLSVYNSGHSPGAMLEDLSNGRLFYCDFFRNTVGVLDLASGKIISEIKVIREPIALAFSSDKKMLFVANHLPGQAMTDQDISSVISVIDTTSLKKITDISLPNGSTSIKDVKLSPDGRYIFATHIIGRYQVPTTQVDRGWINTNALSYIDVQSLKLEGTMLLDDTDHGAANPWGLKFSDDGKTLAVALSGVHELMLINYLEMMNRLSNMNKENLANKLSFTASFSERLPLAGKCPRQVVFVNDQFVTSDRYSGTVTFVNSIGKKKKSKSVSILTGETIQSFDVKQLNVVKRGELNFNDGTFCFQDWQSCISCHPDARVDGLNWDLMNDGMGNPKQTKSMLFSHITPPVMITGIRAQAEVAVRAGLKFIQFTQRPEEDAVAIDEYLKSLRPVPSPFLVKGKLSAKAEKGKEVFQSAACGYCHTGTYFTNQKKYAFNMGTDEDKNREFDTPVLTELWRTAPYFYDGRWYDLKDFFKKENTDDKHGKTSSLSDEELDQLVEYLLSL